MTAKAEQNILVDESTAISLLQYLYQRSVNRKAAIELKDSFLLRAAADAVGLGQQYFHNSLFTHYGNAEQHWRSIKSEVSFSASRFAHLLNAWRTPATRSSTTIDIPGGPLTAIDLAHWQKHGYVLVKNIVARETALGIAEQLMQRKNASLSRPETWQKIASGPIMKQQFNLPELDIIRRSEKARKAFQQLWRSGDLVISRDQYSLNFPETPSNYFQGPCLHLDVDFQCPLHFKTQGIVYLNDVAEDQGAFTLCPGFHHQFPAWLASLPQGSNPNDCDFYQYPHQPIAGQAGDLIIWHHWLPHGSSPNRNSLPRVAQYLDMYSLTPQWVKNSTTATDSHCAAR